MKPIKTTLGELEPGGVFKDNTGNIYLRTKHKTQNIIALPDATSYSWIDGNDLFYLGRITDLLHIPEPCKTWVQLELVGPEETVKRNPGQNSIFKYYLFWEQLCLDGGNMVEDFRRWIQPIVAPLIDEFEARKAENVKLQETKKNEITQAKKEIKDKKLCLQAAEHYRNNILPLLQGWPTVENVDKVQENIDGRHCCLCKQYATDDYVATCTSCCPLSLADEFCGSSISVYRIMFNEIEAIVKCMNKEKQLEHWLKAERAATCLYMLLRHLGGESERPNREDYGLGKNRH